MKTLAMSISCIMFVFATSFGCMAQKNDEKKAIENVIQNFSKGGGNQDVNVLEDVLESNFRIVMNQLFGSKETQVMTRELYLSKIKSKEFGGDKRTVSIENLTIVQNVAFATVTLSGAKMKTKSMIHFLKNQEGKWKIVHDIPVML